MKRPLSVTILGWVYILVGIGGLAYHLREFNPHHLFENDAVTASVVRALAIVAGIFMLQGKNWARWLALAWMAFHVIISIHHPLPQFLTHAVLLALFTYLLFRPKPREYFGVAPTTNNAQSS